MRKVCLLLSQIKEGRGTTSELRAEERREGTKVRTGRVKSLFLQPYNSNALGFFSVAVMHLLSCSTNSRLYAEMRPTYCAYMLDACQLEIFVPWTVSARSTCAGRLVIRMLYTGRLFVKPLYAGRLAATSVPCGSCLTDDASCVGVAVT